MARQIVPIDEQLMGRVWLHQPRTGPARRPHVHDELEFNFVLAGQATYLVDQHRHDLRAGALIWLFPEQSHVLINESARLRLWIVVFRPQLVAWHARSGRNRRLLDRSVGTDVCRYAGPDHVELTNQLDQSLHEIADLAESDNPQDRDRHNALLGVVLLQAWAMFHQLARSTDDRAQIHPAVAMAANQLRQYEEELPLPELASRCGISAGRLSRLFKRQLGMSVTEYRNRARIDHYLQRRARPGHDKRSIMDDALAAGFGSYPQFHRVFRQYVGINPRQFQRNNA